MYSIPPCFNAIHHFLFLHFPFCQVKGRVTLQTLQPSARVKGLVGSHGQIVHPGKEAVKSKSVKNSNHTAGLGKIQVFEDESSQNGRLKPKSPQVEERGIQTDPAESQDFKTLTSGMLYLSVF